MHVEKTENVAIPKLEKKAVIGKYKPGLLNPKTITKNVAIPKLVKKAAIGKYKPGLLNHKKIAVQS